MHGYAQRIADEVPVEVIADALTSIAEGIKKLARCPAKSVGTACRFVMSCHCSEEVGFRRMPTAAKKGGSGI
jgi:hypothetical protein